MRSAPDPPVLRSDRSPVADRQGIVVPRPRGTAGAVLLGERDALEESPGVGGARVVVHQRPELRRMVVDQQMRELVDQHVLEHVLRHRAQARGQPDLARGGGARPPAVLLTARPGDRRGPGATSQVRIREPLREAHQVLVAAAGRAALELLALELLDHAAHPVPLLTGAEGRRHRDHEVPVAAGDGDGAAATRGSAHENALPLRAADPLVLGELWHGYRVSEKILGSACRPQLCMTSVHVSPPPRPVLPGSSTAGGGSCTARPHDEAACPQRIHWTAFDPGPASG
jgi:hypothetical protein